MEHQGFVEGDGRFSGKADHTEAVWAVGCNLKLHDMVVPADHRCDVIAGLYVFLQDKNTVLDTMREFRLLGVQVFQLADFSLPGVKGHQVALVEVIAACYNIAGLFPECQADRPTGILCAHCENLCCFDRAIDLLPGLNVR